VALTETQIGYFNLPSGEESWISTRTLGKPKKVFDLDQVSAIERLKPTDGNKLDHEKAFKVTFKVGKRAD
jgi:hypothetical protein